MGVEKKSQNIRSVTFLSKESCLHLLIDDIMSLHLLSLQNFQFLLRLFSNLSLVNSNEKILYLNRPLILNLNDMCEILKRISRKILTLVVNGVMITKSLAWLRYQICSVEWHIFMAILWFKTEKNQLKQTGMAHFLRLCHHVRFFLEGFFGTRDFTNCLFHALIRKSALTRFVIGSIC